MGSNPTVGTVENSFKSLGRDADGPSMGRRRRQGGLPLASYIVALLLLPLVGVGVFSVREIQRNDRAADAATIIADTAAVRARASALLVPLETARTTMLGLVRVDGSGLGRELVVSLLGIDFEQVVERNEGRLDAAFDALETTLADAGLTSSVTESRSVRGSLAVARNRVDARTATIASTGAVFNDAFDFVGHILDDSRSGLVGADVGAMDAVALFEELDLVVDVVATARERAETFGRVSLMADPLGGDAVVADTVRHLDALDAAGKVDPTAVATLRSTFRDLPELPDGIFAEDPQTISAADFASATQTMLDQLTYLDEVSAFTVERAEAISAEVSESASRTRSRNRTTILVFVLVGLGSLAFGLIVMRAFARPLLRLRLQAERISRGELVDEPLALAGPSDLRKVTEAINDMASTLTLVDDHMQALALAENGRHPELRELPGRVGASMRTSMERVTALTSRLQVSEARLAEEARIDTLTGLPNRFAIIEYLEKQLRLMGDGDPTLERRPLTSTGVMFLDVDGFKSVNDTHGHAVGDTVLREIARRLSGTIREIDIVARLGGDEFLIVVPHVADPEDLLTFGQRLIEEMERPYSVGEQLFGVSASVGVTVIEPGDHPMAAVERADAAVYQAKRRGRRRVEIFDKELQRSIEHQAELELALRQAIQHDELRIHLQPLADLASGRCVGAEALVRWERPGFGLVPPVDFIPVAERSGLVFDIQRWVLAASCRRVAEWQLGGRGEGMRLAVNISGRHLIEGDLIPDIDAALAATGADPSLLEIELTESHLLDDVDRASAVLAQLRSRGIKVAIDDFGTGYSSMTYLQKLPVDVIKIDRSFISTAAANEFDSTIVESVVTIARALSLEVVAEGIETIDQLTYAMSVGVTVGQGFLLARPMPVDDAEAVMFGPPMFDVDRVRSESSSTNDPHPWHEPLSAADRGRQDL